MASGILGFLSGPITALIKEVGGVIDSLSTTKEEKLEAQRQLVALQMEFTLKAQELEMGWVQAQRDTIVAEASGASWLQRNWRPILMLFFAFLIGYVTWTGGYVNGRQLDVAFTADLMEIIKLGIGGYVVGRSAEKIVPQVAEILKK